MESKNSAKLQFANAGLVATLVIAGSTVAQTLPKEGRYDFTSCWSGVANVIQFEKSNVAMSYEMTGTNRSNPPGGMFDKLSFRCVGMNATLNGKNSVNLACEAIDRDGDKRMTYFSLAKDGTIIKENIAGTGKYDGMVSDGQTIPLGPFPVIKPGTFQDCNHQTGTYKLK